jgi:hypothetical protein
VYILFLPLITAAGRSKRATVFSCSHIGIVGSNILGRGYLLFVMFVLSCVEVSTLPNTDPRPGSPTDCVYE